MSSRLETIATVVMAGAAVLVATKYLSESGRAPAGGVAPAAQRPFIERSVSRVEAVSLGPARSPGAVAVYEFIDVECPFCSRYAKTIDSVQSILGDSVDVRYVNMPLSMHRFARSGAVAIECAFRAGRGSAFVSTAFSNQDSIGFWSWQRFAVEAGIGDSTAFSECTRDQATADRVEKSLGVTRDLAIRGTPAIIVGEWRFDQVPNASELIDAVRSVANNRPPKN